MQVMAYGDGYGSRSVCGGRGPPSTRGGHSPMLLLFHTPAALHPVSLLAAETATDWPRVVH